MGNTETKPPIGVIPRALWDDGRIEDLSGAISRYVYVSRPIPLEWIREYNELVNRRG